jgi:hypothetical protein
MSNQEPLNQESGSLETMELVNKKRFGQLSQSRSAILSTVIILFIVDLFGLVSIFSTGTATDVKSFPSGYQIILSTAIDVFLGINLLRGKSWARAWMLVRSIAGIVVWGIVYTIQGEYGSLILNTGVLWALIILLTGYTNLFRIVAGIALAVITVISGMIVSIVGTSMNIPFIAETDTTPTSFLKYSSEGFFSISYPTDWSPTMSVVAEAEAKMKEYGKDVGFGSKVDEVQLVFLGKKITNDNSFAFVTVNVEPNQSWPLETLVEGANQWSLENIKQYMEQSRIKTTIGGRNAIIQTYQGRDVDSYLMGYTVGYVASDKFLWTIICGSDVKDYESNQTTFEQIVRSLRVEY